MSKTSEAEIRKAFIEGDNQALKDIYEHVYPLIVRFVTKNMGYESDAKDVLQEAFLVILFKVRENNFVLTCEFNTYVYAICKNLWLKSLRDSRYHDHKIVDIDQIGDVEYFVDFEEEAQSTTKYQLFRKHFESLSELCKNLLKMFLDKKNFYDIADQLDLANYDYARKKKYKCKIVLINRIKKDPNYEKYLYEKQRS